MKSLTKFFAMVGVVAMVGLLCAATQRYGQRWNLLIENYEADQVKLSIKTVTPSTNIVEVVNESASTPTNLFAIPSTGILGIQYGGTGAATANNVKTNLGIQTGRGVSTGNGTVTNTFGTVFSAVPKVVISMFGTTYSETNSVTSVTVSNFIVNSVIDGVTNDWIAIGTP